MPGALAGARGDRRRRRHVRVGAVVEIEQAALRALEQHVLPARDRVRDVPPGVAGVRRQRAAGRERVVGPALDLGRARPGAAEVRRSAARARRGWPPPARAAAPASSDRAPARPCAPPWPRRPGRSRAAWCRSPCRSSRRGPRAARRAACGTAGSRGRRGRSAARRATSRPRAWHCAISSSRVCGSITMPSPSTQLLPGWHTPDGTRCVTSFWPSITSVWPALAPPP